MRQCINPACSAFAEGRVFNADDLICPRCGNALADVSDDGVVTPVARRVDPPMSQGRAFLLALITFVGVVGVALALAGVLRGFSPPVAPGTPNPIAVVTSPEIATAVAAATRTAVAATLGNTPIPIINLPTAVGNTGDTGATGGCSRRAIRSRRGAPAPSGSASPSSKASLGRPASTAPTSTSTTPSSGRSTSRSFPDGRWTTDDGRRTMDDMSIL
jgi:hypothetical protein